MLKISCLHTAQSDISIFEAARRELRLDDVILKHRVRSDLLAAAEAAGRLDADILRRASDELTSLARGADAVLVTCPTLGPAVGRLAALLPIPVVRSDVALAEAATRDGGRVIILCAAGPLLAATRALFESAAIAASASVEIRLVAGASELLRAGRLDDYHRLAAAAADAAAEEHATVALVQTAMAGALAHTAGRPLTAPLASLRAAVRAIDAIRASAL